MLLDISTPPSGDLVNTEDELVELLCLDPFADDGLEALGVGFPAGVEVALSLRNPLLKMASDEASARPSLRSLRRAACCCTSTSASRVKMSPCAVRLLASCSESCRLASHDVLARLLFSCASCSASLRCFSSCARACCSFFFSKSTCQHSRVSRHSPVQIWHPCRASALGESDPRDREECTRPGPTAL